MVSHNDDLIIEVRDARRKERAKFSGVIEAKSRLRDAIREWKDAGKLVDEILAEIETGSSGRPLIDATRLNGHAAGDGHAANGTGAGSYDRDLTAAVEAAEAKRAEARAALEAIGRPAPDCNPRSGTSDAPLGSRENPIKLTEAELKAADCGVLEQIKRGELLGQVRDPAIVETRPDGGAIDDETAKLARRAADAIEASAARRFGADGKGGITPGAEIAHRKAARKGEPETPPPLPDEDGEEPAPGWRRASVDEWQHAAPADRHSNYRLVRVNPSFVSVRVCNRCNTIRSTTVGVCIKCKSPEFRNEHRPAREALRDTITESPARPETGNGKSKKSRRPSAQPAQPAGVE